ncbi:receptor-like protein kinase FERONIA [Gossypium arboreum]|uniref:receptor-like protein kinase FERONIA n=1 Tax=Gossypium arboreum TaxID=29729 RepID=UPI00081957D5|nr:receptor-like protein kinase FERONIA [Gossypium arboreum]
MSLSHFFQVFKKAFGFVSRRGSQPNSTLPEELCIRQFSLAEIKAATSNFDEGFIIGISNFGSVYKGVIDDGTFTVAIRRVKFSLSAFRTEVVFLSQLNHLNVESLIGFCNEKGETILVYEYLSNGSLFNCLHGNGISCNPIPWEKRLQICIGAARGLHYLHTGVRLGPHSMSQASTKKESLDVMATLGYLDSESLSGKIDVYAFGVVLLEVICGKTPVFEANGQKRSLAAWANWFFKNGTIYHNIDPYLKGRIAPECFNKYVEIAMSCISYSADERPSIGEVEATLQDALELQKKADSEMKSIIPHSEVIFSALLIVEITQPGAPLGLMSTKAGRAGD